MSRYMHQSGSAYRDFISEDWFLKWRIQEWVAPKLWIDTFALSRSLSHTLKTLSAKSKILGGYNYTMIQGIFFALAQSGAWGLPSLPLLSQLLNQARKSEKNNNNKSWDLSWCVQHFLLCLKGLCVNVDEREILLLPHHSLLKEGGEKWGNQVTELKGLELNSFFA